MFASINWVQQHKHVIVWVFSIATSAMYLSMFVHIWMAHIFYRINYNCKSTSHIAEGHVSMFHSLYVTLPPIVMETKNGCISNSSYPENIGKIHIVFLQLVAGFRGHVPMDQSRFPALEVSLPPIVMEVKNRSAKFTHFPLNHDSGRKSMLLRDIFS